ncbi:UDP-2,3-diacylglucosamine hydrolase [Bacteroidia bacterium]|nr:UDP-2,3-diacylglucosamine hydrolase [Bacteroidia bacterium]
MATQQFELSLLPHENVYFASDFHLGAPSQADSFAREQRIVQWLDTIAADAKYIFLLGDVFDFWFEYRYLVPKGHVLFLGKLVELRLKGIEIHYFTGNHDAWTFGYLEQVLGLTVHRQPCLFTIQNKTLLIGHGDGLGKGDNGYKFFKLIYTNIAFQWLFAVVSPRLSFKIAHYLSKNSRSKQPQKEIAFTHPENEMLYLYCQDYLQTHDSVDFFVLGHRHYPLDLPLVGQSRYINTGDWLKYDSYAKFSNGTMSLIIGR